MWRCQYVIMLELGPRDISNLQSAAEIMSPWNAVPRYLQEECLLDIIHHTNLTAHPLMVARLPRIPHGTVGSSGTFASYTIKAIIPTAPNTTGVITLADDHSYRTPPQVSPRR